jgi:O-antigen ligase
MLSERPIFGAGISGFPLRVAPFRGASEAIHLYPDNLWLTTWTELGLLGLLSFAVIFFSLLWRGWRAVGRATGVWRPVIWGASGALVLYLVHGLFDSPYWKNDLSVEFWLMAAFEVVAIRGMAQAAGAAIAPDHAETGI